jgi:GNAT superfamily N-acetyltransferase
MAHSIQMTQVGPLNKSRKSALGQNIRFAQDRRFTGGRLHTLPLQGVFPTLITLFLITLPIRQSMQPDLRIRPAVETDIPAIHALMFELAVYENSPESVETTPEEYAEDFRKGRFESMVAEMDGKVVGMMLYFMAYSSWRGKMLYLDDFVVNAEYRRFGIGQMLFDAFLEEGKKRGCRLVKWQVLDWNEPALRFYYKNDAIIEKDWWNAKIFLRG